MTCPRVPPRDQRHRPGAAAAAAATDGAVPERVASSSDIDPCAYEKQVPVVAVRLGERFLTVAPVNLLIQKRIDNFHREVVCGPPHGGPSSPREPIVHLSQRGGVAGGHRSERVCGSGCISGAAHTTGTIHRVESAFVLRGWPDIGQVAAAPTAGEGVLSETFRCCAC